MTRAEMDPQTADRYAAQFLGSAGVVSYADRRRASRIRHALWVVSFVLVAGLLALTAGPSLVITVHQGIVAGHQAVRLIKWSPQP